MALKAWAAFAGVVGLALAIAVLALRPPSPASANAPAEQFSAARAFADVAAIAQRPHPIRSPEQARVRDYLFGRMVSLGLAPRLRPAASDQGGLFNLLGVLPGADRASPAVLLMAHFDSVPAGPGAADDGAGVAAVLEAARALQASGPRGRDVMVLLTDGEEPGLYGAKAFFSGDPLRGHVGVVINLEARGNRGRAVMFETHRQGGAMVGFLTRAGALSGASSLMPDLYRRLPNDTDLTEALTRGYPGINFAFFNGFDAYHRPSDTPGNLDPGSLQSIGAQVLAAARALATAPALPGRAPDQVYADILGGPILHYPAAAGWLVLGLAVVLIGMAAWRELATKQTGIAGIAAGVGAVLGLVIVLAMALIGDGMLRGRLAGPHLAPFLRHAGEALTGAALLAAGLATLWLWSAQKALRPASLSLGGLKVLALFAILLQLAAPLDAFMLAWPLLLAAAAAAHHAGSARPSPITAPFVLVALAQLFYWAGLFYALAGQESPAVLAPFAAVATVLLLPLAPRLGRPGAFGGAALAVLGLALSLVAMRP
ncbi:MAG: peptidase [Caulobacteraceae bacterium]|nr:peptidase [Caulobacteraceae bacterium]